MAILNQMMNPHWPHLPKRKDSYENEKEKEVVEGAWRTITDDPLDYHFYYHILDGDEGGRPPKVMMPGRHAQTENKYFNWRDKSCLHLIAKSRNMVRLRFFKNSNYSMCGYPVFGEMCAGVIQNFDSLA